MKITEDTSPPEAGDGMTVVESDEVEDSVLANEEDVKMEAVEDEDHTTAKDSLLDELLDDDEGL